MIRGGAQKRVDTAAVLDMGTEKVTCMIGQRDPNMGVRLLGAGIGVGAGLKGGVVVDMEAAEAGIRTAVQKAERQAGMAIQQVAVNVSTRSLRSQHMAVQTEFASGEVADRDLQRVISSSLSELSQPQDAIIHAIPMNYTVDDEQGIRDPRGMFGSKLGVDMHFVMAGMGPLRNLAHCVERCHLRIESAIASPYAAGLSVLTDDERDLGVTVIDMGAGITTAAIFRDNALVHVSAVPIGAQAITSDIARGLTTPMEAAERIKVLYGSALHGADDDHVSIPCPPMGAQDMLHHEPKSLLTSIIRSRVEEMFEMIRDNIHDTGFDAIAGRRIVLTGGGAHLNGVREVAELIFNKRVRIGRPHGILGLQETLCGPDFAVATGILKSRFAELDEAIDGPPDLSGRRYRQRRYSGGALGRSMQWLRENF